MKRQTHIISNDLRHVGNISFRHRGWATAIDQTHSRSRVLLELHLAYLINASLVQGVVSIKYSNFLFAKQKSYKVNLVLNFLDERADEFKNVDCVKYNTGPLLLHKFFVGLSWILALDKRNLRQFIIYGSQNLPYTLVYAFVREKTRLLIHRLYQVFHCTKQKLKKALRLVCYCISC